MRMHSSGQLISEMRAYIDSKYSQYGTSNAP
jgi:hypothetical protein